MSVLFKIWSEWTTFCSFQSVYVVLTFWETFQMFSPTQTAHIRPDYIEIPIHTFPLPPNGLNVERNFVCGAQL